MAFSTANSFLSNRPGREAEMPRNQRLEPSIRTWHGLSNSLPSIGLKKWQEVTVVTRYPLPKQREFWVNLPIIRFSNTWGLNSIAATVGPLQQTVDWEILKPALPLCDPIRCDPMVSNSPVTIVPGNFKSAQPATAIQKTGVRGFCNSWKNMHGGNRCPWRRCGDVQLLA